MVKNFGKLIFGRGNQTLMKLVFIQKKIEVKHVSLVDKTWQIDQQSRNLPKFFTVVVEAKINGLIYKLYFKN